MTDQDAFSAGEVFSEQSFSKLDLAGSDPRGRRFESCRFIDCRITASAFRACSFLHCVFQQCDLSNWDVEGLRLVDVSFRASKLVGVQWSKLKADPLTSYGFEDCMLDYADFSRVRLSKFTMLRCTARRANFERAVLKQADLRETDFSDAVFSQTDLDGADLRGARAYAIDPRDSKLKGARVSLPEALGLLTVMDLKVE